MRAGYNKGVGERKEKKIMAGKSSEEVIILWRRKRMFTRCDVEKGGVITPYRRKQCNMVSAC